MNERCFFKSKKGLGPVVATALLIVVAVVSLVAFQDWFSTYSSSTYSSVETRSSETTDGSISIDVLVGNMLYVKNNIEENLSISKIKIGNLDCNISDNLSLGMNEVDVSSCINNVTSSTPEVVIVTDKKIVQKSLYLKGASESVLSETEPTYSSCPLDGVNVSHGDSYVFYSALNEINCSLVSQNRTCNNGVLNGSSAYCYSTCDDDGEGGAMPTQ